MNEIKNQCDKLREIKDDIGSLLSDASAILNGDIIKKSAPYSVERAFHYWLNPMLSLIGNEDIRTSPVVSMVDTIDDISDLQQRPYSNDKD